MKHSPRAVPSRNLQLKEASHAASQQVHPDPQQPAEHTAIEPSPLSCMGRGEQYKQALRNAAMDSRKVHSLFSFALPGKGEFSTDGPRRTGIHISGTECRKQSELIA